MSHKNSKPSTYTVQICFKQEGTDEQLSNQSDIYLDCPLGTPLPHTDDKIMIDNTFYKIKDRFLIISDNVIRDASWSLVLQRMDT